MPSEPDTRLASPADFQQVASGRRPVYSSIPACFRMRLRCVRTVQNIMSKTAITTTRPENKTTRTWSVVCFGIKWYPSPRAATKAIVPASVSIVVAAYGRSTAIHITNLGMRPGGTPGGLLFTLALLSAV